MSSTSIFANSFYEGTSYFFFQKFLSNLSDDDYWKQNQNTQNSELLAE